MISNYLVNKMIESKIITESDRALYLYGIREAGVIFQNIVITLTFGILFQNFFQTVVFLGAYIPLRSFAGGYHAASAKRCSVYSLGLILILEFYFSHRYLVEFRYLFSMLIIAICIIYKASPLQSPSKPLSSEEKYYYALVTKKVLFIECSFIVIFSTLNLSAIVDGISMALIVEGILLTVGIFI